MASAFTHAIAAAALGSVLLPGSPRLIALGALCAAAPDLDVVGFRLGIAYADVLGHRGLTHSLPFALLAALLLSSLLPRVAEHSAGGALAKPAATRVRCVSYLFCAIASHGLLDALTNGGLGVAFLAPFSEQRYFFPWRPILVSPISVARFFTERGLAVLKSELVVVWLPALLLAALGAGLRHAARRRA
jgi:inner membrane protein